MMFTTATLGCVEARPLAGPHGESRVELQCGGWAYRWADCFERAQQVCGGHYNVIDADERISAFHTATVTGEKTTPTTSRALLVECNR
jgi:hypothetical protein